MTKDAPRPFLLTILTGPNAGAQVSLGTRAVRVGRDDADVLLDDEDAAPVTLSFSGERVRILAGGDGAALAGAGLLPVGKPVIRVLPATLNLSARTQVHVCRAAAAAPRRSSLARALPAGALILAIGAVAAVAGASVLGDDLPFRTLSFATVASPDTVAVAAPGAPQAVRIVAAAERETVWPGAAKADAPAEVPADPAAAAAQALQAMTAEAGLIGLTVEAEGGAVRVSGRQSLGQNADWARVRAAFDREHGANVPLLLDVTEEDIAAPIAVASAWLGAAPEIATRDGAILREGDQTEDGWTVTRIAEGEVELDRGDQSLVIEF